MPDDRRPGATSVYLYFDAAGRLLYVGITGRGHQRAREHERSKPWWPLVARAEVQHFSTRKRALEEERYLISYHQPPHNTQGRSSAPLSAHRLDVPYNFVRSLNGRLAWQKTLEAVDIDALAPAGSYAAHHVRQAYFNLLDNGGSVSDLRQRLRALFDPEKSAA
jgi:predicted GIY-YIG superfamily endonuclease